MEEFVGQILSFLSFEEQIRIAYFVCKSWKARFEDVDTFCLENNKRMIKHFQSTVFPTIISKQLKQLKCFKVSVEYWEQKNTKLITPKIFRELCLNCKGIKELYLPMCSELGLSLEGNCNNKNERIALSPITCLASSLEKLDLSGCNLSDMHILALSELNNLKELNLSINRFISDNGLKHLLFSSKSVLCNTLEALDISYTSITDNSLTFLTKVKNLRQLHLMNTAITTHGMDCFLKQIQRECKVERLNLLNCNKVNSLSFLQNNNLMNLKALMYNLPQFSKVGKEIVYIQNLSSLKELVLVGLDSWNVGCMDACKKLTLLETLSLRCKRIEKTKDSSIEKNNLVFMKLVKQFTKLRKFDLHVEEVDLVKEKVLSHLSKLSSIEFIDLKFDERECLDDNEFNEQLEVLFNSCKDSLTHLFLNANYYLNEKGLAGLMKGKKLSEWSVGLPSSVISFDIPLLPTKVLVIEKSSSNGISMELLCKIVEAAKGNLEKLSIRNVTFSSQLELKEDGDGIEQLLKTIALCSNNLIDFELDLNIFKFDNAICCSLDPILSNICKLTKLQRLCLYNNETSWTVNKTILPLSKTLNELTSLEIPIDKINKTSPLLFEKFFPQTTVKPPSL